MKKELDFTAINYSKFSEQFRQATTNSINELESAAGAADEQKAAQLGEQKAKLDQQIAALQVKKAALQKQIDAIEKR